MIVALTAVISITPRLRCLAISFRLWPAGRISSKIMRSSGLSLMVHSVSLTVRAVYACDACDADGWDFDLV